jgi:uncharacterized membrane protein YeaQ/YmgE (transglycosylase-associated protein family)
MPFVWMMLVGLMVAAIARPLLDEVDGVVRGSARRTEAVLAVLAVAGSFVAGFVGRGMGFYDRPGEGAGIVASLLGAMSMILVYRAVRERGAH